MSESDEPFETKRTQLNEDEQNSWLCLVSSKEQNLSRQIETLKNYGVPGGNLYQKKSAAYTAKLAWCG